MTTNNIFSIPCSLNSPKYQLNSSDRKLNLLEHRLTGPSKDGNSPITPPSTEKDIENLRIKLFQIEQQSTSTKTNSRSNESSTHSISSNLKPNSSQKNGDLYDFLLNKRNLNPNIKNDADLAPLKRKCNFSSAKSKKMNRNVPYEKNNSKLKDYYKSASSSSISLNESESRNFDNDVYTENADELRKVIMFKERVIDEKNSIIASMKNIISDLEQKLNAVNNYYNISKDEIEKCQNDIKKFVKENEELKRQILKKEINDSQYTLGKLVYQKLSNGQIFEYFEEGNDFKTIARSINDINAKKKALSDSSANELVKFKLNELNREENELKIQKELLNKQKAKLFHDINVLRDESRCSYMNKWIALGNRYQLVSLLGKGGYSEVYKAYDLKTHMFVACKIHQLNPMWKEEVKDNYIKHTIRENQILKEISHKNIIKHYDTIEINNNSFCSVLELCNGSDLGSYIKERKMLNEGEVRIIASQILDALGYLNQHRKKIIHYDLKPQNIIFHNMEVKLTDFGLAKILNEDEEIELTSQGVGTYYYLPPECFERGENVKITPKVDIWSLGIVVYEMLYGKKPFGNNCRQERFIRDKVLEKEKEIIFDDTIAVISNKCKQFIKKCLEFEVDKRYDVFEAINSNFMKSCYTS